MDSDSVFKPNGQEAVSPHNESNLSGSTPVAPEATHAELLADGELSAARQLEKDQAVQAMRLDRIDRASRMTEQEAKTQAAADVAEHASMASTGWAHEAYSLRNDMAERVQANPSYAAALQESAPELSKLVTENQQNMQTVKFADNLARAAAQEEVTIVTSDKTTENVIVLDRARQIQGEGRAVESGDSDVTRSQAILSDMQARQRGNSSDDGQVFSKLDADAIRTAARLDLEALHEIRSPIQLDDAAEVVQRNMANPIYREEFARADPEAAKAMQTLAKDASQFDEHVSQNAELSIDGFTEGRLLAARMRDREEALRILGAGRAEIEAALNGQKHAGSRDEQTEFRAQPTSNKLDDEFEYKIPAALTKKYIYHENKFYLRDTENKLAFEVQGTRMATSHNDPDIAKSMVELASSSNWTSITVKGTNEFAREAWLHATLKGMEVKGYTPKEEDLARLADLQNTRGTRAENPSLNSVERGRDKEVVDETRTSDSRAKAAEVLKELVKQKGGSDLAADLVAKEALKSAYVGKIVEHGKAPYKNNPENEDSYYVKLQTPRGERVLWGVDLGRLAEEDKLRTGDQIALEALGRKQVTVKEKVRDESGKVTGTRDIVTHRVEWAATQLSKLADKEVKNFEARAAREDMTPHIRVFDQQAARPAREVPKAAPTRQGERQRG